MRVLITQVGSLGEQKPFYAYSSEAADCVLVLAASPRRSGRHAIFACTKRSRYVIVKRCLVNSPSASRSFRDRWRCRPGRFRDQSHR